MKYTKISTIILVASISCTLKAVEWKKIVAALAIVGSCTKITDPNFVPNSTARAFAEGVAGGSIVVFCGISGTNIGRHLANGRSVGSYLGSLGGGLLGGALNNALSSDMQDKPRIDHIAKWFGFGCGQPVALMAAAAFSSVPGLVQNQDIDVI